MKYLITLIIASKVAVSLASAPVGEAVIEVLPVIEIKVGSKIQLLDVVRVIGADSGLESQLQDITLSEDLLSRISSNGKLLEGSYIRKLIYESLGEDSALRNIEVVAPRSVRVRRVVSNLDVENVIENAKVYLIEQLESLGLQNVSVSLILSVPIFDFDDASSLKFYMLNPEPGNRMCVWVKSEGDNKATPLWFRVKGEISTYKMVRNVRRGSSVAEKDYEESIVNISELKVRQFTKFNSDKNYEYAADLSVGDIIYNKDITTGYDVKPSQVVSVISVSGGVKVHATARPLERGYIGETVKLESISSSEVFSGKVVDTNTVVVRNEKG